MMIDARDTTALRLLGAAMDALRCVTIYRSEEAAKRPVAAWQLLPLGHGPGDTVAVLMTIELGPGSEDVHETHLAYLEARTAKATAAWLDYTKGHGNGRYENHVTH